MKKIYIDTLGCAKNEYDSQMLAASLINRGCSITYDPLESDIMIVNTCGFIEDAKRESIERILELAEIKDRRMKLVVTGCLSERYHKDLVEEMPEVDMFFGVNDYDDLPGILLADDNADHDHVGDGLDDLRYRKRDFPEGSHYGYLKIAEGCNNACSFCAIPMIRGRYRSKRMDDCVREARDMADAGIRELILIAQDTSLYGADLYGELKLPELLKQLCRIDGLDWIRLMYVYDNNITDEMIKVIAEEPKICKYIDMPIQHVSDNVLARMNRRSTGASIRNTIRRLREIIPDVHIRTTLLVGFPGESESDLRELIDFLEEMKIDRVGAFAFSDEEGTASYDMAGKVPEDVKAARRDAVMSTQLTISEELNMLKIGRTYDVMVDECVELDEVCVYSGRTMYDAPEIDCAITFTSENSELYPGDIVKVRVTDAYEYDLEGEEIS